MIPETVLAGLEVFEQNELARADKIFGEKKWRQATAEYDSFILQFPRSPALAYALMRKARSLQLDGKRFEAIKQYTEVLDYFPNAVEYAAPASYFIGLCNVENGDVDKAIVAWTKMADDKQYSKHPTAAAALTNLSNELARRGNWARAVEYYKQAGVEFRNSNPPVAREAINQAVYCYIRVQPNEPKLREFYLAAKGFGSDPLKSIPSEADRDREYWGSILNRVNQHSNFDLPKEADARKGYFLYWAKTMGGKFLEWDDYQITIANYQLAGDGDAAKWTARMDEQFAKFQKDGDFSRIVKWIQLFGQNKAKANEYFSKLTFDKMSAAEISRLVVTLFDPVREPEMARNTFTKLPLSKMPDSEKQWLFQQLWNYDAKLVEDLCMSYEDKDRGRMNLLQFYYRSNFRDVKKAMDLAQQLINSPTYAFEATMIKAQMLQQTRKFEEAIATYQTVDKPEQTVFAVAECYVGLNKTEQAVAALREAENFLKDKAPEAALRIAHVYRDAKMKDKYIAALRGVLGKYPKSPQSSKAHLELEAAGITKVGGGVDAQ